MGNGHNVMYLRVSTVGQNEAEQREALKKYGIDKEFLDKASGKDTTNRPQLNEMMKYVRSGDRVYIYDFSRIARNTKDLLDIVETLQSKGVELISHRENIDTSTPSGKLMLTMLGAIAEFERANQREKMLAGIELAKQRGVYNGRKKTLIADEVFNPIYERYQKREINKGQMAAELGITRPTLEKLLKEKGKA